MVYLARGENRNRDGVDFNKLIRWEVQYFVSCLDLSGFQELSPRLKTYGNIAIVRLGY